MPSRVALAPYTIQFRERESAEYVPLDGLLGHDLLDMFEEYLVERAASVSDDPDRERVLRLLRHARRTDRTISAVVESGEYGYEGTGFNVRRGQTSYRRTREDAELLPFYLLLSVPANSTRAVLILERFRIFGVRSVLWKDFLSYIEAFRNDYVVEINPLIPSDLIDRIRHSEDLKKVRFIKFSLPPDIVDNLDPEVPIEEEDGTLELIIKAPARGHLPVLNRVTSWLRGEAELGEVIELRGVEYDQVKVEVDVGGKQRTVDLTDFGRLRAEYDVSDEVEMADNGHPDFDSLHDIAADLLQDLHDQLGIG